MTELLLMLAGAWVIILVFAYLVKREAKRG